MASPIRFNESAFLQAQRLAVRRSVSQDLIQGLGPDAGLSNASGALLAGASIQTTAKTLVAEEAIQSRLEGEGNLKLAQRLGPQVIDQNVVSNLASGNGGLTLRDQTNLVTIGLKSLGGPRGATVNFLA